MIINYNNTIVNYKDRDKDTLEAIRRKGMRMYHEAQSTDFKTIFIEELNILPDYMQKISRINQKIERNTDELELSKDYMDGFTTVINAIIRHFKYLCSNPNQQKLE